MWATAIFIAIQNSSIPHLHCLAVFRPVLAWQELQPSQRFTRRGCKGNQYTQPCGKPPAAVEDEIRQVSGEEVGREIVTGDCRMKRSQDERWHVRAPTDR